MIIVSNTSPIVNLAAIGQLELLEKLFQKIIIPQAVYHEIAISGKGQPGAYEVENLGWIETKSVNNWSLVTALCRELDRGEAEAIALAIEEKADLLLLDERIGREVALRFDVQIIGLLGIIIHAKQQGYFPKVKLLIDELMNKAGFWISPVLYKYILTTAGENEM
jgi:predicted nucleic acid-binding protein